MAERRMLSRRISLSEKFADLKTDKARLLYLMQIPHTDDYGLFDASPRSYKALVAPLLKITPKQVEEALEDMEQVGLIHLYKDEQNNIYGRINGFERFQKFQADRSKQAKYPLPVSMDSKEDSSDSKEYSSDPKYNSTKDNITKLNLEEEREEEPPAVRFIQEIQTFTARPPCTSAKLGTPDYGATMFEIGRLIEEHGYDMIIGMAREIYADDGSWSVFQFEWKIRDKIKKSQPKGLDGLRALKEAGL